MGWVETWFPWWVEEEDEDEDWSILDKKAQEAKQQLETCSSKLQAYSLNPLLGADQEQSKVISMLRELEIASVSKLKTTPNPH